MRRNQRRRSLHSMRLAELARALMVVDESGSPIRHVYSRCTWLARQLGFQWLWHTTCYDWKGLHVTILDSRLAPAATITLPKAL